jgi:hypothetical protein
VFLTKRINNVNDNFFDKMGNIQYWLLGLLASDGYVKDNYIYLSQSGQEGYDLLMYINNLLQNDNVIRCQKTSRKISYKLYFSSKKITDLLTEYNITQCKSLKYKLPVFTSKYDFYQFIRGYIDGDGCVGIYTRGNSSTLLVSFVGTKEFIYKCNDIFDIKGNIRKHSSSSVYEIRWYGEKAIQIGTLIYSDNNIFNTKKYKTFYRFLNDFMPRYVRYNHIKKLVLNELITNPFCDFNVLAKRYNFHVRSIYPWITKWQNKNIINDIILLRSKVNKIC